MANTSYLHPIETAKRDTRQIEIATTAELKQDPNTSALTPSGQPWKIVLNIGAEPSVSVTLEVSQQIMIGRADLVDGFTPGLDMSRYGGQDAGVSRRHALLIVTNNGLYVHDLASTNGTRLNGFVLKPNETYMIKEGDRLEFGTLPLTLQSVVHSVVQTGTNTAAPNSTPSAARSS